MTEDEKSTHEPLVLRLKSCRCPFCGRREIYVITPQSYRKWWVVGCESSSCDSIWKIEPNTGEQALGMLERSESLRMNAQADPRPKPQN